MSPRQVFPAIVWLPRCGTELYHLLCFSLPLRLPLRLRLRLHLLLLLLPPLLVLILPPHLILILLIFLLLLRLHLLLILSLFPLLSSLSLTHSGLCPELAGAIKVRKNNCCK